MPLHAPDGWKRAKGNTALVEAATKGMRTVGRRLAALADGNHSVAVRATYNGTFVVSTLPYVASLHPPLANAKDLVIICVRPFSSNGIMYHCWLEFCHQWGCASGRALG